VAGSAQCTFCSQNFYRPHASSPAAECTSCGALPGVSCIANSTIETLQLERGHWRHSTATTKTYTCRSSFTWSPCRGGSENTTDHNAYCAAGYHGPRCELCNGPAHSRYFDKLQARCKDCGNVSGQTITVIGALLLLLAATYGLNTTIHRIKGSPACDALLEWIRTAQTVWRTAGMRYKLKALVGFYQCIAAVPSVFDVVAPLGLEDYTRWIDLFELLSELENIFVPSACLGNYRTRVLIGSSWPIGFLSVFTLCFVCWDLLLGWKKVDSNPQSIRTAVKTGLQRALPLTLGLTFLVLPSVSTRIFRTFICEPIEYSEGEVRRYLKADLAVDCNSDDHERTRTVAFAFIAVWPVGTPAMYAALLWASRHALVSGKPTPLSKATAFLSQLEMCRKLILCVRKAAT
jgi:hypothetical protein